MRPFPQRSQSPGRMGRALPAIACVALAVSASLIALPSPAQANEPVRSGRILAGSEPGYNLEWHTLRDLGCQASADCVAWLTSGCDPALAGKNPGVQSSIVNVANLGDGTTERIFRVRSNASLELAHTVVQFWGRDPNWAWHGCYEIPNSRSSSWHCWTPRSRCVPYLRTFQIPAGADWMTVTSSRTSPVLDWTLR